MAGVAGAGWREMGGENYRTAGICEEYLEQGAIGIGRPSQGLFIAISFPNSGQFST